ncbi:MAG: DUF370 domain-containing protein [Oscillospiraceae bacterium]|nr:DUF370 domain-containing protein [Oscillospiraceae bacterium]
MYLHLGGDIIVNDKDIIGIFDIENTSIGKSTKDFLSRAQKENKVINVSFEMPKSYIVCEKDGGILVYISQISVSTLKKRAFADSTVLAKN